MPEPSSATAKPQVRPGLLVDIDGTLVDTNYLHTLAWSRALRDAGEWAPMNAIHRLIGMSGEQLVPKLLGHELPEANDARARRYRELLADARAFPGAAALLRTVHDAGLAVILATSSPADEVVALRKLIDADDVIDGQTTADDVGTPKPAPDVFLTAMRVGGICPEAALAIGDSKWDIQAARAAGIGCVGLETGGFSQHELAEAGALHVYRDVREINQQFRTSPLAALLQTAQSRR